MSSQVSILALAGHAPPFGLATRRAFHMGEAFGQACHDGVAFGIGIAHPACDLAGCAPTAKAVAGVDIDRADENAGRFHDRQVVDVFGGFKPMSAMP